MFTKKFIFTILLSLLVLGGCSLSDVGNRPSADETGTSDVGDEIDVEVDEEEADISDWQTYRNEEYGFEIRYPEKYEVAIDTYGWPNAVALFKEQYGQAYDAQIEVWDTSIAFKEKYDKYPLGGQWQDTDTGKFISVNYYERLDDSDYIEEWSKVIETFKFTD